MLLDRNFLPSSFTIIFSLTCRKFEYQRKIVSNVFTSFESKFSNFWCSKSFAFLWTSRIFILSSRLYRWIHVFRFCFCVPSTFLNTVLYSLLLLLLLSLLLEVKDSNSFINNTKYTPKQISTTFHFLTLVFCTLISSPVFQSQQKINLAHISRFSLTFRLSKENNFYPQNNTLLFCVCVKY